MVYDELEEGQIVLCTVEKIIGTTVFVTISGNGEGTITTSEISPGRIRNLRDFVVPGKKIVCKILKITGEKVYLSLRRVKQQEKKELLNKIGKERSYLSILKTVLGPEKSEKITKEINEEYSIADFFEQIKTNKDLLLKYLDKEDADKIKHILESKKEKPKEIKQLLKLSSKESEGIIKVKNILQESCKDSKCTISYIAAGKYRLNIKGENFKEIKGEINKTIESIENLAKKEHCDFSLEKS